MQSEFFHGQREMLRRVFTPESEQDQGEPEEEDDDGEGQETERVSLTNGSTPPISPMLEFDDLKSC